jgi:hypothetical protein
MSRQRVAKLASSLMRARSRKRSWNSARIGINVPV